MNHCTFSDSATSALVSFPNPLTLECWLAEGTLWEGQIWSCLFFPLILTIFVLDSNYVPNPVVTIHSRRGIWLPSKFAPLKHQGFHSTNQLSRVSGFGKLTSSAPLSLPCMTVQCPRLALLRLPCQSSFFSPLFSLLNFFFSWTQVWLLRPSHCQSSLFSVFSPCRTLWSPYFNHKLIREGVKKNEFIWDFVPNYG